MFHQIIVVWGEIMNSFINSIFSKRTCKTNSLRRYFNLLIHFLLLISHTFVIASTSIDGTTYATPHKHISNDIDSIDLPSGNSKTITYDYLMDLFEKLENDELESEYSLEELEKFNHLLALLASQGILPPDDIEIDLADDIKQLLNPEVYFFQPANHQLGHEEYSLIPAHYTDRENIVLCKSKSKKNWEKTKKFFKKHKKEIIVGAAIVGAVTIAVCIVVATSGAATPLIGAAGAASSAALANPEKEESSSEQADTPQSNSLITPPQNNSILPDTGEAVLLTNNIENTISAFKGTLVEDEVFVVDTHDESYDNPLPELGRESCSFLAHELIDGIAELTACVPEAIEEVNKLAATLTLSPEAINESNAAELHPVDNFNSLFAGAHNSIDRIFSTDFADSYTPESKEERNKETTIAILPPFGIFGGGSGVLAAERLVATEVSSIRGWQVGGQINNLTATGEVPKWNTVRGRYWKNRAYNQSEKYTPRQIKRMRRGFAPQRRNPTTRQIESKELHHIPAQRDGGLFDVVEVWPDEHAAIDQYRKLRK